MKRFVFYFLTLLFCSSGIAACGTEEAFVPDKETLISKDSIFVVDTIIHSDNTFTKDTIILSDTIIQETDTIIKKDTIILAYEKYMQISPSYGTAQGAACYEKYFFQGYSNNAALGVYDLEKKNCSM